MNKKVTIIGAGPAGLVAAANLLNSGVEVTILEKTKFPRISVGESLLPISIDHFRQVGIFDALDAADFLKKYTVRFIKGEKQINFVFAEQYTENAQLWTWQVARARFDQTMANAVIEKGAKILFETEVTAFNYDGKQVHVSYKNAEGEHTIDS
ncbi:MAG: FAD-dependent monooxygenase, partial [Crocinitomicaceae bacterium]